MMRECWVLRTMIWLRLMIGLVKMLERKREMVAVGTLLVWFLDPCVDDEICLVNEGARIALKMLETMVKMV